MHMHTIIMREGRESEKERDNILAEKPWFNSGIGPSVLHDTDTHHLSLTQRLYKTQFTMFSEKLTFLCKPSVVSCATITVITYSLYSQIMYTYTKQ